MERRATAPSPDTKDDGQPIDNTYRVTAQRRLIRVRRRGTIPILGALTFA